MNYIWPLLIIVFSNTLYQICAKGIPVQMNTYASMTITYAVATIFSAAAFFITTKGGNTNGDLTTELISSSGASSIKSQFIFGRATTFLFMTSLWSKIKPKQVAFFWNISWSYNSSLPTELPVEISEWSFSEVIISSISLALIYCSTSASDIPLFWWSMQNLPFEHVSLHSNPNMYIHEEL